MFGNQMVNDGNHEMHACVVVHGDLLPRVIFIMVIELSGVQFGLKSYA